MVTEGGDVFCDAYWSLSVRGSLWKYTFSSRDRWFFTSWWNKGPMKVWQELQQAGRHIPACHVHMIPMYSQYFMHLDSGVLNVREEIVQGLHLFLHLYSYFCLCINMDACDCRHVCIYAYECVIHSIEYGNTGWWTCGFHILCSTPHVIWHGPVSSDKSVKKNQVMRLPQRRCWKEEALSTGLLLQPLHVGMRCSGVRYSACREKQ